MLTYRRGRAPVQNGSAVVEAVLQIADRVDTVISAWSSLHFRNFRSSGVFRSPEFGQQSKSTT